MDNISKFMIENMSTSIFYDFEFAEYNGNLDVISMGAYTKDYGGMYYVNAGFFSSGKYEEFMRSVSSEDARWMANNVFSHLDMMTNSYRYPKIRHNYEYDIAKENNIDYGVGSLPDMAASFMRLARSIPKSTINTFGYFSAHDHACLSGILGGLINMPKSICQCSFDIKALSIIQGVSLKIDCPHHPYYDAKLTYEASKKLIV